MACGVRHCSRRAAAACTWWWFGITVRRRSWTPWPGRGSRPRCVTSRYSTDSDGGRREGLVGPLYTYYIGTGGRRVYHIGTGGRRVVLPRLLASACDPSSHSCVRLSCALHGHRYYGAVRRGTSTCPSSSSPGALCQHRRTAMTAIGLRVWPVVQQLPRDKARRGTSTCPILKFTQGVPAAPNDDDRIVYTEIPVGESLYLS